MPRWSQRTRRGGGGAETEAPPACDPLAELVFLRFETDEEGIHAVFSIPPCRPDGLPDQMMFADTGITPPFTFREVTAPDQTEYRTYGEGSGQTFYVQATYSEGYPVDPTVFGPIASVTTP